MLETLLNPKKAERKPWELFFIGFFYVAFSMLVTLLIFSESAIFGEHCSILIITFTVMLSLPFMYFMIKFEEKKDSRIKKEKFLIKEHGKALLAFIFLFLGFLAAFSMAYIVLPQDIVNQNFGLQIKQYCAINSPADIEGCVIQNMDITGKATTNAGITGNASGWNSVLAIFHNNIYVLLFCIIFSLAFGAGAIFILTWNASVIGAAIGIFSENLASFPAAFLRYMLHGLPEIGAFLIAGLAGGIVSVAAIKHSFTEKKFWHVLNDSISMIILAVVVLFAAALIEVFITPAFF